VNSGLRKTLASHVVGTTSCAFVLTLWGVGLAVAGGTTGGGDRVAKELGKAEQASHAKFREALQQLSVDFSEIRTERLVSDWPFLVQLAAIHDNTKVAEGCDMNIDGNIDLITLFDDTGGAVRMLADRNHDGRIDKWAENVEGHEPQVEVDRNFDGTADYWCHWEPDGSFQAQVDLAFQGNATRWIRGTRQELFLVEDDRNCDGECDRWWKPDGEKGYTIHLEENFDGRVDRKKTYAACTLLENFRERLQEACISARGRLVYEEADTNNDGAIDSWVEYDSPSVYKCRNDLNFDGTTDSWVVFQKGSSVVAYDTDFDGAADVWQFVWPGGRVLTAKDADGDGSPDRVIPNPAQRGHLAEVTQESWPVFKGVAPGRQFEHGQAPPQDASD